MREAIKHPLSWAGFYKECIRHALAGMWGVMSSLATALGLIGGAVKAALSSASFVQWTAILAKHGGADLFWEIPAVVLLFCCFGFFPLPIRCTALDSFPCRQLRR